MSSAPESDHADVIRKINATLRGPVVDVLCELAPEVRDLPRRKALELILDDVELLDRCFQVFRRNPEQFRHLLVDKQKVSVEDAEALLECGRSLDQVVAMVVRTAAKRHFRMALDGVGKSLQAPPKRKMKPSLVQRLQALFAQKPAKVKKTSSRGEVLYAVFQDLLLHDWQVPIIPEYSRLSPAMVRRMGTKLLDYRLAEDIRRLRADPDNPPPPTPVVQAPHDGKGAPTFQLPEGQETAKGDAPASITTADQRISDGMAPLLTDIVKDEKVDNRARLSDILTADGKRLKGSAFTASLLDPKVRKVLPNAEQTLRISNILGAVNGMAGKVLVSELGFRVDQLAVFIMASHSALGESGFEKAFGIPGRPDYIMKIVEKAKSAGIGQSSELQQVADFVAKLFAAATAQKK